MRRMLDELKKMDYEYEVPANFSKKVMKEIKNIEAQKKKNMKKYVITWASTAAVILLAVTVTLKTNTKSDNLAFEKDSWQSMQMYSSSNAVDEKTENNSLVAGSATNENKQTALDTVKSQYLKGGNDDLKMNGSANLTDNTSCMLTWLENSKAKKDEEIDRLISGDTCDDANIEKTLTENGITIEEINDEYMILNANIDEVKTILKEYEDLISITEVNGKVKIQKEV